MDEFKVEITDSGVSILEREILYNGNGDPVSASNHRSAIGLGDFAADAANPTEEERNAFRSAVQARVDPFVSRVNAEALSNITTARDELSAVKSEVENLRSEIQNRNSELAARKSELESATAELKSKRDQIAEADERLNGNGNRP